MTTATRAPRGQLLSAMVRSPTIFKSTSLIRLNVSWVTPSEVSKAKASSVGKTGHSRGPVGSGGSQSQALLTGGGVLCPQKEVGLLQLTYRSSRLQRKQSVREGQAAVRELRTGGERGRRQQKIVYLRHLSLMLWTRAHCFKGKGKKA